MSVQSAGALGLGSVLVNLAAVPDLEHQHNQTVIFKATDEAVIADSVTPEPAKIHAQRLAESPRVVRDSDSFPQVAQDGLLSFPVEFAQLTPGTVVELYRPGFRRLTF